MYALSYPAATGEVITQGHADYCAANGCATLTEDGIVASFCPRCGESNSTEGTDMTTNCTATNGQYKCTFDADHAGTHIDNYTWHGFPRRGEWANGDDDVTDTDLHTY